MITDVVVKDIRFPTSRNLDGSDAMNEAPDYSTTYADNQKPPLATQTKNGLNRQIRWVELS